jgi:hypothetical protein
MLLIATEKSARLACAYMPLSIGPTATRRECTGVPTRQGETASVGAGCQKGRNSWRGAGTPDQNGICIFRVDFAKPAVVHLRAPAAPPRGEAPIPGVGDGRSGSLGSRVSGVNVSEPRKSAPRTCKDD